jgi:L-cysteine desulfidase
VKSASRTTRAVLEGGHTNLVRLEKDGTPTEEEGFVGRSAEETIKNMSRISEIGMSLVDKTITRKRLGFC